jgi:undecaprenyl-diphosphatase
MQYIGLFFLFTSFLLFMLYTQKTKDSSFSNKWKDVLFIGMMQGLALLPGISRSGSTIWAAKKRNWPVEKAIQFSFLLAIPATVGGSFLESILHIHDISSFFYEKWPSYLAGFFSSFAVSLVCAKIIFSFKSYKQFLPFAWYCLIIGIAALIYMNLLV